MSGFQMVIAAILFLTIQKPDRIFPTKLDHFIQKKKFK
jgi:hypothetical protein